jgi:hypothetical protein
LSIALGVDDDAAISATPAGVLERIKPAKIGFTTDANGRLATLDIYLSNGDQGGHYRAYRWSISAADAAPLLTPELRDLTEAPAAQ